MSFVETFEAPHLGMDTESAPHRLAKGYARDVVNMLTGTPGRIRPRGAVMTQGLTVPLDGFSFTVGTTYVWASGSGMLMAGAGQFPSTTLKYIGTSLAVGASGTATASSSSALPGRSHVAIGDVVYGVATGGGFLRWDGNFASPTLYTNGPKNFAAITYWLNRLWTLGGQLTGVATVQNDRIGWSDQVDASAALPDSAAAWQDDVSGLTNQIVLPSVGQGGSAPVGFGRLPNAMVVFGTHGGDMLVGSSPSGLTVRPRVVTHGCVDKRTIVEYNGSIIWLAPEGLFAFDGVQEVELSASIRTVLRRATDLLMALNGGKYQATLLPNDYLLVTLDPNNASTTQLLLHLPTRSWSRLTIPGAVFPARCIQVHATYDSNRYTTALLWDKNDVIWSLDGIVQPDAIIKSGSFVGPTAPIAGVDVAPSGLSLASFPASYDSRLALLSQPSRKVAVSRVSATSKAARATATAPAASEGWFVTARAPDDSTVLAKQQLSSAAASALSYGDTKHDTFETFAEADQLYVHVDMGGSGAATFAAMELQDIYIEYDVAQKPASF